jgi:hypothetical protein
MEKSKTKHDVRIQVPVDVAVKEPWAGVVGKESDGYKVRSACANAHDIADDRVDKVVACTSSTPNHVEGMLARDNISMRAGGWGIYMDLRRAGESDANIVRGVSMPKSEQNKEPILTGPATTRAGIVSSTLLLASRP